MPAPEPHFTFIDTLRGICPVRSHLFHSPLDSNPTTPILTVKRLLRHKNSLVLSVKNSIVTDLKLVRFSSGEVRFRVRVVAVFIPAYTRAIIMILWWKEVNTDYFDSILRMILEEEKITIAKQVVDFLDYIIFIFPLGVHSIICSKDAARCREITSRFGQNQRELVSQKLREKGYIEGTSDDISIRVFKKKFRRLVLEDKMKFCSREITGKLSFSIKKKEGLCTKAYSEGRSMLEIEDGSKDEYNLTTRQKALAEELKFIVAVPISDDSAQSVKRVICFDSFQKIAKSGCEEGILKICEQVAYNLNSVIDEG